MTNNNLQPTAQLEDQARSLALPDQATLLRRGLSAVGGSVIHDDDGDVIGRVYTLAEVCDEIMGEVRP